MAIMDVLNDAKNFLAEAKRKRGFRRANRAREAEIDLQNTRVQCRGKLELCLADLNRTINNQSRHIAAGMKDGADTSIQELMLWDAAIGYMLVKDAIFALKTINSYDSVSHAYEMLDAAVKQMSQKKSAIRGNMKIGSTKERNAYGYITSNTARKAKEDLLESFFEALKVEGDIERHLADARASTTRGAERRFACAHDPDSTNMSELDDYRARMNSLDDDNSIDLDDDGGFDDAVNIRPPKDSY